jgi:hypothetical protein
VVETIHLGLDVLMSGSAGRVRRDEADGEDGRDSEQGAAESHPVVIQERVFSCVSYVYQVS